ncbi:hypothetical protein [Rhodococcus sp. 077-4]|uniref:hypothetical protein n=1 Tax=Rhodococcus sp. 077-4 TaxID=2789271 RepID=UPI0039F51D08
MSISVGSAEWTEVVCGGFDDRLGRRGIVDFASVDIGSSGEDHPVVLHAPPGWLVEILGTTDEDH